MCLYRFLPIHGILAEVIPEARYDTAMLFSVQGSLKSFLPVHIPFLRNITDIIKLSISAAIVKEKNIVFTVKRLFCNLVADGKQRLS